MYREPSFQYQPESLDAFLDEAPHAPVSRPGYSSPRSSRSHLAAAALALAGVGEGCATTGSRMDAETGAHTNQARFDQEHVDDQSSARQELQRDASSLRFAWGNMPPEAMVGLDRVADAVRRERPGSPVTGILLRLPEAIRLAEVFHEERQIGRGDRFPLGTLEGISDLNRRVEAIRQDPQAAMDIAGAVEYCLDHHQIDTQTARLFLHRFIHPNALIYRAHHQQESGENLAQMDQSNPSSIRLQDLFSDLEIVYLRRFVDIRARESSSADWSIRVSESPLSFLRFEDIRRIHHTIISSEGTFSRQIWDEIAQESRRQENPQETLRIGTMIEAKIVMFTALFCGARFPGLLSQETNRMIYRSYTERGSTNDDSYHEIRPLGTTIRASEVYDQPGHTISTTRGHRHRGRNMGATLQAAQSYDQPRRNTSE